jgi:predicted ATPase/class 3 adenylate cyclase/Flp pilus assembly protein TadD
VASPPTGTLTFVFTDIEGSTKLWEHDAPAMQVALARHDELLRRAIEEHGGYVFKTVGDAFCAAFLTAPDALEAALDAQRLLLKERWGESDPLRVRMALHMGAAEERDGDYFGPPVNKVARLLSAGHGGQVLLSLPTQELVRDQLPAGTSLMDLGERRLKDLFRPERIFQLTAPSLPSEFPPLRTLESHPNNLPLQPTPLVGRERETREVADRVCTEEVRLLTLTGPGGTGKTRLALQAAADLLEEFSDGAFFVTLATITDPELVPSAIAGPLGVKESAEQHFIETLKNYLQGKELLLLLDNFEQVLKGASFVGELVATCPKLKVLATSRIPLRLYGEQEYPVPPLALPDPRVLPPLKALTQYEAVRLFVERARAVKADFEVTNENAPAVAEICARLDGLPLAIELAAARVRLLSPEAMLTRLNTRLKLLKGGPRDLPTRQQTLRGTIDWSYELLEEEEKTLFGRLSVFSGGRTLEAIEEICDPEGAFDALEGVESLLEKSLLRREEGAGGESRFVMLETVHEYAREKLQEGEEAEAIKEAHAEYFLRLTEEAEPELKGPDQLEWLERLEAEHDNLRAALSWSLGGADAELGLRLAGALWYFWSFRGYFSEGRGWLEEAIAGNVKAPPMARARALRGLASLAVDQGDYERAGTSAEEALALYRGLGDDKGVADCLGELGWASIYRGDYERAAALFEEGLAAARESDDAWSIAFALNALSVLAGNRNDFERAEALWEEALALGRKVGDRTRVRAVLTNMGYAAMVRGDFKRAEVHLEEGLAIARELNEPYANAGSLLNLGIVATRRGDHGRAKTLLEESLALHRELGSNRDVAECLEVMAEVAGGLGEDLRAGRLWGAAGALRQATDNPWLLYEGRLHEPYLSAARSQMEESEWSEAWQEGWAMTLDEAVSYALEEGAGT